MPDLAFESALREQLHGFIEFKETCSGKVGRTRRWHMRSFDRYCAEHGFASCCREAVEGWGARIEETQKCPVRSWLSNIREFARYLRANGCADAYIAPDSYKTRRYRPKPYLFTEDELAAFFDSAANLETRRGPWAWQAPAYFGLMHSCGLRTCEVRGLTTAAVDLSAQRIDIVGSKGGSERRLPITSEVAALLEECGWNTSRFLGTGGERPFFVSRNGNPIDPRSSGCMFRKAWSQAGLPYDAGGKHPRAYDLRHHFAYANIERWAAEGLDVNAMLPYLSRYMGHADIRTTLYYIHTSPDFMSAFAGVLRQCEALLPEVGFDA